MMHFSRRTVPPLVLTLGWLTAAQATYVVVEADLYPNAALERRERQPDPPAPERFKLAFGKGTSTISPMTRSFVDSLVPRMQKAERVMIVGHIDSAASTTGSKQRELAMARASALRTYLTRAGVAASIIEIKADATGNSHAASAISAADLYILNKSDPRTLVIAQARDQIQPSQEPAIPHKYPISYLKPAAEPIATAPAVAAPSTPDARLLEYINQAVQNGTMLPAVAAQILRSLAYAPERAQAESPPVPAVAPAPIPAPTYLTVALSNKPSVAPSNPVERWVLDSRLTLKDNLDDWAKASGWRAVVWEASNFYQVTRNTVLDGAFPDVLKRVADSTGLNICVKPSDKVVRVTDSNVPCTNQGVSHAN